MGLAEQRKQKKDCCRVFHSQNFCSWHYIYTGLWLQGKGDKFFKRKCGFERIHCSKNFNEWLREALNGSHHRTWDYEDYKNPNEIKLWYLEVEREGVPEGVFQCAAYPLWLGEPEMKFKFGYDKSTLWQIVFIYTLFHCACNLQILAIPIPSQSYSPL